MWRVRVILCVCVCMQECVGEGREGGGGSKEEEGGGKELPVQGQDPVTQAEVSLELRPQGSVHYPESVQVQEVCRKDGH